MSPVVTMPDGKPRWFHARGSFVASALVATILAAPSTALAHPGTGPDQPWQTWSVTPLVMAAVLLTLWVYARGVSTVWRHAGVGHGISALRVGGFLAGMTALVVAIASPLDTLSAYLLSAHMVQHMVLILVVAPLLVLSTPLAPLLLGLPPVMRHAVVTAGRMPTLRGSWSFLTNAVIAGTIQVAVFWLWHLPPLYEAALHDGVIHDLEHASFLLTAALFWWVVIQPVGRRKLGYGPAVLLVVVAGLAGGILGALLTFSSVTWYPDYQPALTGWDLTALQDQQLAGLIMWIPGGLIYLAAALGLAACWLNTESHATSRTAIAREPEATQRLAISSSPRLVQGKLTAEG